MRLGGMLVLLLPRPTAGPLLRDQARGDAAGICRRRRLPDGRPHWQRPGVGLLPRRQRITRRRLRAGRRRGLRSLRGRVLEARALEARALAEVLAGRGARGLAEGLAEGLTDALALLQLPEDLPARQGSLALLRPPLPEGAQLPQHGLDGGRAALEVLPARVRVVDLQLDSVDDEAQATDALAPVCGEHAAERLLVAPHSLV
mmetsp:Transcript_94175/g.266269  ORF Transcript_94175/g.266269 Transcript_94175/m.266269 type:complete len:202 (-) Transcript_94175:530-1135(-)